MKSITRLSRLSARLSIADISKSTTTPAHLTLVARPLHTTTPTLADELTTPQKIRKRIWGDPGPADPYAEITPEERERREIAQLEAEEAEKTAKAVQAKKTAKQKSKEDVESGYVPDDDARSMLIVGTRGAYMKKDWDPKHRIVRYLQKRLTDSEEITAAVRRAVIETFTQAAVGKKPSRACVTYKGPEFLTDRVSITTTNGGKDFKIDFKSPEVLRRIREYTLNKQPLNTDLSLVENIPKDSGEEWLNLGLGSIGLKFAVVKRSMQLTGIPLTDPVINNMSNVRELLSKLKYIASQSGSTKLAPALAENEDLSQNSNVAVHQYQLKFTDKERSAGRLDTIPIMMAGRVRKEGELIGRGPSKDGRRRVTRSMLRLRARKMKGWGVTGIETFRYPKENSAPIAHETAEEKLIEA